MYSKKKFQIKKYSFGRNGLLDAAKKNNIDDVRSLLAAGANVNAVDTNGNTSLHWAGRKGRTEIVKLLLAAGANVNAVNTMGNIPLHWAGQQGRTEIVKLLLAAGANVNAVNTMGNTPLYLGTLQGNTNIVKLLLAAGANVNVVNTYRDTPLYLAVWNGNIRIIKLLLAAGENVNNVDNRGYTPLHMAAAAYRGHTKTVKLLLTAGANVNNVTTDGYTPLHFAAERGHTEIVKLLLDVGADINIQNNRGETAFDLASTDEIRYLLNPMGKLINVRTPVSIKNDNCSICLDPLNSNRVVETNCGHQFHLKCLNELKKTSSSCPLCRKSKAFFGKRSTKKSKAKVPKKLTLQAKKFGIKLTVKRNGRSVRKTNLMKHIATRKKVVGRPRKSLPFLKDIRKNRMSFDKKMETLKKTAKKLGIRLTTKRNGKRVDKPKSVLSKQIAVRKKMVGKQGKLFGRTKRNPK